MTSEQGGALADRIAARATGVGVGLLAFMIAWLVGARLTDRVWGPPSSAVVAMSIAVLVGIVVTFVAGRRLLRRQLSDSLLNPQPSTQPATRRLP